MRMICPFKSANPARSVACSTSFLATVCSVVDEMEKLAFQSSTISNYGKKDYGHFLRYKNMAEKRISAIEQQIRIMNNVYLKQYGVDKDIVL